MFLKSLEGVHPEPFLVRHPVPYGPELRRDEAIAAFSAMPLLGNEAGIEQDAEVLRDGRPAHLEMFRKRVDGAGGLHEEVEHPAPCRMADCCEDVGLAIGNQHHAANIRDATGLSRGGSRWQTCRST